MKILRKICLFTCFLFLISSSVFCDENYQVQKGDTLYSISRKYQITVAELRTANNLSENDVLKAGQKLVIPTADIGNAAALSTSKNDNKTNITATSDYVVQKGDTLYSLARNNGMTLADLLALNNMDSTSVLKVGQKIKIAKNGGASSTKPSQEIKTPKVEPQNDNKLAQGKTPDTRVYGKTETDTSVSWPVKNPKVTYIKGKVSGVQLSCKQNESVKSVRSGTVMYVGTYRGFGQVLFVQSKTGLIYAYTGLGSVKVRKGDYVVSGDEVGTAGVDPIKNEPQITFMVFQNGTALDPAKAPRG